MLVTNFRLKYVLYKLVLAAYQLVDTGRLHPARARAIRALERSVDYIESNMADALGFDTQKELLSFALRETKVSGHYLEFGVYTGGTIRYIAKLMPHQPIHGFDSFEGLPSAWSGFNLAASAFSLRGKLPRVPPNVVLHKGRFNDVLPGWCRDNPGPVAFMHIDCDIYSSTADILNALEGRLQPGSVIVFDEYFNYANWERHEFKAWKECVARQGITYEYLGYARQQVAVRVTAAGGRR